jgi:hypothetical protein
MDLKLSRLFVLLFGLFSPIYILVVFLGFTFELAWLPFDWSYNSKIISISANWVAPILYCIGWIYFMLLLSKRFASTIELMGETSSTISAHYIIFYGVCALVMLISFLIPLFTPIVGVLSFSSMVFSALTSKVAYNELDAKTQKFVKTVTFIVDIPIIFCTILVVPELIGFSVDLFLGFWQNWLDPLYFLMKGLGVALPIGNFWLLYRNAIGEMEGRRKTSTKSNTDILFTEIVITVFLFILEWNGIDFVQVLYYGGFIFWVLSFIINFIQGRNSGSFGNKGKTPQNPLSLVMYGVFWIATTIFGSDRFDFSDTIRKLVVGGAAFVFIVVFLLVFIGHPDLDD